MKRPILSDSYCIINLVFAGIILAVLAYSFYFGEDRKHPIPSGSEILTGKESVSTGLSRSFSAMVRFRFAEARSFNPYGPRVFMFFLLQLFMRIAGFFQAQSPFRKVIIRLDIILTIILFFILFRPFLSALWISL